MRGWYGKPTTFFLASKRVVFNFVWATSWFAIVFAALLAFEYSLTDPLRLGVGDTPDGADGLRWWRNSVAHIMLTGVHRELTTASRAASSSSSSSSSALADRADVDRRDAAAGDALASKADVDRGAALATPDVAAAFASQSLLLLRQARRRSVSEGGEAFDLDESLSRRLWTTAPRPHYPALAWLRRLVARLFGGGASSSARGKKHRMLRGGGGGGGGGGTAQGSSRAAAALAALAQTTEDGDYGDARNVGRCGSVVFVDGRALGTAASGAYSVSGAPAQSRAERRRHRGGGDGELDDSGEPGPGTLGDDDGDATALFEGFVHCGSRRDSPSSIGRRIDQYFRACPSLRVRAHRPAAATAVDVNSSGTRRGARADAAAVPSVLDQGGGVLRENKKSTREVTCVAPGVLALLLLHRRIRGGGGGVGGASRVAFVDIGAGSDVMATIAASALHGMRQSERIARARRLPALHAGGGDVVLAALGIGARDKNAEAPGSARVPPVTSPSPVAVACSKPQLAAAALAPPAVVITVDAAPHAFSPLDASRMLATPANRKLLLGGARTDCGGADPDRVVLMVLPNVAIGPSTHSGEAQGSERFASWLLRPRSGDNNDAPKQPDPAVADVSLVARTARTRSDLAVPRAVAGGHDVARRGAFRISPRVYQCFHRQRGAPPRPLDSAGEPNSSRNRDGDRRGAPSALALASVETLALESEHVWQARLAPHVDARNGGATAAATLKTDFARVVFTPVARVLDRIREASTAFSEREFAGLGGGDRARPLTAVAFADVGGYDADALDCGAAESQAAVVVSLADAVELAQRRGARTSVEAVVVLRPIRSRGRHGGDKEAANGAALPLSVRTRSGWRAHANDERWRRQQRQQQQQQEALRDAPSTSPSACGACDDPLDAAAIADATVDALVRVRARIVAGCVTPAARRVLRATGRDVPVFEPLEAGSPAARLVRAFLTDGHGEARDERFAVPSCTLWMQPAPAPDQGGAATSDGADAESSVPLAAELRDLRASVAERVRDDASIGDMGRPPAQQAMAEGLASASADDGDGDDADGAGASNAGGGGGASGNGGGGASPTVRIALVALALLVAFFLIRGVCRNFLPANTKKANTA
jgi:hypothetical protein